MRRATCLAILLLFLISTGYGCGGSKNLLKKIPTSINSVKASKRHTKKIAVMLTQVPDTTMGRTIGEFYLKTMVEAIQDEDRRSKVIMPQDAGFPAFLASILSGSSVPADIPSLAQKAQQAGYQGWMTTTINSIHPYAKKRGLIWFRKTRYYIHVDVTVDVYDPYTASKIASEVMERSVRVSEDDYESYKSGREAPTEDFNNAIKDIAEDLGELVGEALKDHNWKASIVKVAGDRVYLPVGSESGLNEGEQMAVFKGRRILKGLQGELYTVPGFQIGEIQITAVSTHSAEGKLIKPADVQPGDIVVPTR